MIVGGIIVDLVLIGLGIAMRSSASERNAVFGYRTARSLKSADAWEYANRRAGKLMIVIGLICLTIAALTAALSATTPLFSTGTVTAIADCLYMLLPVAGLVAVIPIVEHSLKAYFPERDTRKVASADSESLPADEPRP